jgi:hypothetical protein
MRKRGIDMRTLSREEKRIINMLFNHLFSKEYKIKFLKLLFPSTTIDLNKYRNNDIKINEIFDLFFDFEDKIQGIKLQYEVNGYNYNTIEEIIENRAILTENESCPDWKIKRERQKQKYYYA